jgi:hypothetical protein
LPKFTAFITKTFLEHPHSAGETYLQHLAFCVRKGVSLVVTGLLLIYHGLVPRYHQTTASERVFKLYEIFKTRLEKLNDK